MFVVRLILFAFSVPPPNRTHLLLKLLERKVSQDSREVHALDRVRHPRPPVHNLPDNPADPGADYMPRVDPGVHLLDLVAVEVLKVDHVGVEGGFSLRVYHRVEAYN